MGASQTGLDEVQVREKVEQLLPDVEAFLAQKSFEGMEGEERAGPLNRTLKAMGSILASTKAAAKKDDVRGLYALKQVFLLYFQS